MASVGAILFGTYLKAWEQKDSPEDKGLPEHLTINIRKRQRRRRSAPKEEPLAEGTISPSGAKEEQWIYILKVEHKEGKQSELTEVHVLGAYVNLDTTPKAANKRYEKICDGKEGDDWRFLESTPQGMAHFHLSSDYDPCED